MKVTEDKAFLSTLFPNVMKKTRLLIIDHDVCRYHSFDLLRYQLYLDTLTGNKQHFKSLKSPYRYILQPDVELSEKIRFMQNTVNCFNIFECFDDNMGVINSDKYTHQLQYMLCDTVAKITPTDVNSKFNIVFDRKNIDGFLLRYRNDMNKPSCYDQMVVYETESILDLNTAVSVIKREQINAVMICSVELAVHLAARLYKEGYTSSISFIIGRYCYNFIRHDETGEFILPLYGEDMRTFELRLGHEFGYFDPFSQLTYRAHFIKETGGSGYDPNSI